MIRNNKPFRGHTHRQYVEYWVRDIALVNSDYARVLDRAACFAIMRPRFSSGVRPIVHIKGDTVLSINEDGVFCVMPTEMPSRDYTESIYTDEELFQFLGLR